MRRSLLPWILASAALLFACPDDPEPPACGTKEAFDLSACAPAELDFERAGIWHLNGAFDAGTNSYSFDWQDPAKPFLNGLEATTFDLDGGIFFSTNFTDGFQTYRISIAVCRSSGNDQFTGLLQQCTAGRLGATADVEGRRLVRRAGEAEASGVTLLGESLVPEGEPRDLFVSGNLVFVAAGRAGVFVYDVSNPAAPVRRAQLASASEFWFDVVVHGNHMYVASFEKGVHVYVIRDAVRGDFSRVATVPTAPEEVSSLAIDAATNKLYASAPSSARVLVFDITNPAPLLEGAFSANGSNALTEATPRDLVAFGGKLYAAWGTLGYVVADTSVSPPVQIGTALPPDGPDSQANAVGAIDGGVYAFEVSEGWGGHVRVLDVTGSPITPLATYGLRPEIPAVGVDLLGSTLFVAHAQDGLRVVDLANPASPSEVGYFNVFSETQQDRGRSFVEGLFKVQAATNGSGLIYGLDTQRGLMIFTRS